MQTSGSPQSNTSNTSNTSTFSTLPNNNPASPDSKSLFATAGSEDQTQALIRRRENSAKLLWGLNSFVISMHHILFWGGKQTSSLSTPRLKLIWLSCWHEAGDGCRFGDVRFSWCSGEPYANIIIITDPSIIQTHPTDWVLARAASRGGGRSSPENVVQHVSMDMDKHLEAWPKALSWSKPAAAGGLCCPAAAVTAQTTQDDKKRK